ncbi:MAG TPA: hypothetical protein VL992_12915 [Tepidisphaeraceae bacterium]|nr:hypothetical protein [Tepidisphaeraceae bacterium]
MNIVVWMYAIYLAISFAVTVWVARVLYRRGGVFLLDAFGGNAGLADSVNHLLVVGFYLVNIGYVAYALQYGNQPDSVQQLIEDLSAKLGIVLMILGGMHFMNLVVFASIRHHGIRPMLVEVAPAKD